MERHSLVARQNPSSLPGTPSDLPGNDTFSGNSSLLPEQWVLCPNAEAIANLQEQYGLIQVTATPTNAALQPGWPQTLVSILLSLYGGIRHLTKRKDISDFSVGFAFVLWGIWLYTFANSEKAKETGGWISATDFAITFALVAGDLEWIDWDDDIVMFILAPLQGVCTIVLLIQRFHGWGSVAYEIVDDGGCTPFNDLSYLQQGARAYSFRAYQIVAFIWGVISLVVGIGMGVGKVDEPLGSAKSRVSLMLLFVLIPILVYEIVIATRGTPVVISGDCTLVELDPRWGYLDTDIETYWKALVTITGL